MNKRIKKKVAKRKMLNLLRTLTASEIIYCVNDVTIKYKCEHKRLHIIK